MALMSFDFSDFHTSYLKKVVKGSGMSMKEYIEVLIDSDIESKTHGKYALALAVHGDYVRFINPEQHATMICNSVTGDPIRCVVTDEQSDSIIDAFKMIMNSNLCESVIDLGDSGSIHKGTHLMVVDGEVAAERIGAMLGVDVKKSIF